MTTPQSTGTLLQTTTQTLTNGQYPAADPALVGHWLSELAHYDGLESVRVALGSLQNALLNHADWPQISVLLLELSEYTQAFARQTTGQTAADLNALAQALQTRPANAGLATRT